MINNRPGNPIFFVCLSLIVVAVAALAFAGQQPSKLNSLTDGELKEVVITLERTACYGSCPAYKVTIYGDGRVEYEGGKNVKVLERKQGQLEAEALKKIIAGFDKANFFAIASYSYDNCSCTLCTDMPTATTEIRAKGLSHRVEHYYGCRCAPKELWELEQSIDAIAETQQWTGDVSKQGPFGTTCFSK